MSSRLQSLEEEGSCYVVCDASWKVGERRTGLAAMAVENGIIMAVNVTSEVLIRSVSEAEGMALVLGMKLAETIFGNRNISLKTDSSEVSRAANVGFSKSRFDENWLSECSKLLSMFKSWEVEWVARDLSMTVDLLARKARVDGWEWSSRDSIPRLDELAQAVAIGL